MRCRREAGHDGWHESLGVSWAVATGARRPQTVSDVQTPQPDPENPPTVATAGRAADSDDWPGVPTAMDMDAAVRNGWVDVGAGTLEATGSELDRDLIDKVNAGAALVYALYHDHGRDGSDDRWWKVVGDPVMDGYHKACEAYEVGRPRVTVDPEAGRSADDAVRCQYTALGSRCVRDADHQGSHKTVHRPARPQDFNVGRCMETNARGRQCYRDHGHEGNHQ